MAAAADDRTEEVFVVAQRERFEKGPFFNGLFAHLPRTAEGLKNTYYLGDHSTCARHLVASSGMSIPPDLFPNERDRVDKILREGDVAAKSTAASK